MNVPIPKDRCRVYVKSVQGGVLRTLFETLKELVHDGSMIFSADGAKLATMDAAKCSLVHLKLRADCFEEFVCTDTTPVGINFASMHKLMRTCGSHDTVVLYVLHETPHELGIRIQNSEKNSQTAFLLKLLELDDRHISLPEMTFDSIYTLPSATFQRLCRDMQGLSHAMTITAKPSTLEFSCTGDFASQVTVIGEASDGLVMETTHDDDISATYSLKYLTLFSKSSALSNTVSLFIKSNHPLVIEYAVAGLGRLAFMLSPHMDEME
jgi:proliferating cell nuclear antigen